MPRAKSPTAIQVPTKKIRKYTRRSPYWDTVGTNKNSVKKHKKFPTKEISTPTKSEIQVLKAALKRALEINFEMMCEIMGIRDEK